MTESHSRQIVSTEQRAEIISLINKLAWLIDHGKASQVTDYFHDEGSLEFGERAPNPGILSGIEQIRKFFEARESNKNLVTRHLLSNVEIDFIDAKEVSVNYILTVYRCENSKRKIETELIADVEERLVIDSQGKWKIKARSVDPVLSSNS